MPVKTIIRRYPTTVYFIVYIAAIVTILLFLELF